MYFDMARKSSGQARDQIQVQSHHRTHAIAASWQPERTTHSNVIMVATALSPTAKVRSVNESSDEGTAPTVAKSSKKRPTDTTSVAPKKRKTMMQAKPVVQKNTLDSWFGVARKAPSKLAEVAENIVDSDADMESKQPKASPLKKREGSPAKLKHKVKKLTQRRILLGDQCRVCESAKTETSTRCERKCIDCEMTVHMSCYGVDEDDDTPRESWRCRPCQGTYNLTVDFADDVEDVVKGIPVHTARGESDRFHGVYCSSEFASVFLFLKRFRRLGLKLGAEVTLETLSSALLAPRDTSLLQELHSRLLQNLGITLTKTSNWAENVIRFLKNGEYSDGAELVLRLASIGNANDWLSTYCDAPVADRVTILKLVCEAQFDENDSLVDKIGHDDTTPESLRDEPLGSDAMKRAYYLLEDPPTFADGSAWLCRCHSQDGSDWETVADDLASLQSFATALSHSTETSDLQLWQTIVNGVLKSLERREKKRQLQAQRMARMPRLLGSTGLDTSSILPEESGRSLRTRRAVNYRSYVDESSEEEESEAEDDEENDDDDDNDEEERSGRPVRGRSLRRMPEERPTRTSNRLRGGSRPSQILSDSGSENEDEDDEVHEETEETEETEEGEEGESRDDEPDEDEEDEEEAKSEADD